MLLLMFLLLAGQSRGRLRGDEKPMLSDRNTRSRMKSHRYFPPEWLLLGRYYCWR